MFYGDLGYCKGSARIGSLRLVIAKDSFYTFVHFVVRFLNPGLEDLGSQGSGSSLITDHGSRILDRRPLAEQKTTSEQVWTIRGGYYIKVPGVDFHGRAGGNR